jgi:hypothetical protein
MRLGVHSGNDTQSADENGIDLSECEGETKTGHKSKFESRTNSFSSQNSDDTIMVDTRGSMLASKPEKRISQRRSDRVRRGEARR